MSFAYLSARSDGRLVQGELLAGVIEYVPLQPPVELPEGANVPVRAVARDKMVVLTQDCDLEQDFRIRSAAESNTAQEVDANTGSVPSVLLCQVFDELKPRVAGGDIFRRARRNQDERYHTLPEAPIGDGTDNLAELYLDFRKFVALPTGFLYDGVTAGGVRRLAVIPPVYLHDLVHRFHGYLSRVAIDAN